MVRRGAICRTLGCQPGEVLRYVPDDGPGQSGSGRRLAGPGAVGSGRRAEQQPAQGGHQDQRGQGRPQGGRVGDAADERGDQAADADGQARG